MSGKAPSKAALAIRAAHERYKAAIGTETERSALRDLEAVVRRVKRDSRKEQRA